MSTKKIYAFCNHKGGVGKTTSTMNIGVGLSMKKKKTLLIDLDPQSNLSQSFGFEDKENNIYKALKGQGELQPYNVKKNLDIIPSVLDLSGAELELSSIPGRELILSELLKNLNNQYQYILLDCPPSLGLLTLNGLAAANGVLIPIQSQYLAVHGLKKILEIIDLVRDRLNKNLKLEGLFITQHNKRKVLNRDIHQSIIDAFGEKVFKTVIRDNIALAESPAVGKDIFDYRKSSHGAEDYRMLTNEILKK